ncbi:MAG: choice-of-anchor D domain-containing protein [Ilumatobacteraceae bacterium]
MSITPEGGAAPTGARNLSMSALGDVTGFEYDSATSVTGVRDRQNRFTTFPADLPAENHAMSDDGCVIAYSGPQFVFGARVVRVLQWYDRCTGVSLGLTGVPGSAARPRPALDADGSVVVFAVDTNLVVFTVSNAEGTSQVTIPTGLATPTAVAVSDDGNTVAVALETPSVSDVYLLDVASRAFSPVSTLDKNLNGVSSDPSISGDGTLVAYRARGSVMVFDRTTNVSRPVLSASSGRISNDGRHLAVRLFAGDNSLVFATSSTEQPLDFGSATGPTDLVATVSNVGPSGWRVTSIETTGNFSVRSQNCPDILNPGDACAVTVRFLASEVGPASGELLVRDDSYRTVPLTASGSLAGLFAPDVGLSISPDPVVFAETVVGQRAPSRVATVRNTGEVAVTVQSVAITGGAPTDYPVDADGCSGRTLAPSGTCQVRVGFEPGASGERVAQLLVSGTRGAVAAALLRGAGRFDAVLTVLPEVVSGGQVVGVTGEGYPPNAVVQVTLAGSPPQAVLTDAVGAFFLQWLVLEGTPQGVLIADDVASAEYDADPEELTVVATPVRPQGVASQVADRRHVSR